MTHQSKARNFPRNASGRRLVSRGLWGETQCGHVHPHIADRLRACRLVSLKVGDIGPDIGTQHESLRDTFVVRRCAPWPQHPGLRWHVGFDLTRPRARLDPNEKIYSRARSVNEPPDPRGRLTIEPHGFWAVFTVNHRRMSCVKVSSRFSLRWWSCRWRSCQLVLRTLRTRPRRRQLKLRPLPPSHLPRSPSFPGRPSRPVRWRGGAAIGVVVGDRSVGPWGVCTGVDPGGEAIMVAPIGAVDIIGAATAVMGSITAD
jgi:hypothetical protein